MTGENTDTTPGVVSLEDAEVRELHERMRRARGRAAALADRDALMEALSDAEIEAERKQAEWLRRQGRKSTKAERKQEVREARAAAAEVRWHRKAMTSADRKASPHARLATVFRRAEWSSRALIGVVILGMIWAGVNVQQNLVPSGDMSDPLYWLSFGLEAMISVPIIVIMVTATTATLTGDEVERGKIVLFEITLLTVTIGLNCGPHLAASKWGKAAEFAIAPIMVGVVIWLHAWVGARYARMISRVTTEVAEVGRTATVAHSVRVDHPVPAALGTGSAPYQSVTSVPVAPVPASGPVPATPAPATAAPVFDPATVPNSVVRAGGTGGSVPVQAAASAPPVPAASAPVAPVGPSAPAAPVTPGPVTTGAVVSAPSAPVTSTVAPAAAVSAPVVVGPLLAVLARSGAPVPVSSAAPVPAAPVATSVGTTPAAAGGSWGPSVPVRPIPVLGTPVPAPAQSVPSVPVRAQAAPDPVPAGHSAAALDLAEAVQATGAGSSKPAAVVADVIAMHDRGMSVNAIEAATKATAEQTGEKDHAVSYKIVKKITEAAAELRAEGGGATVITLRK